MHREDVEIVCEEVDAIYEADDELTRRIIGCAIAVHRVLGPELLESAYEECLCYEMRKAGLAYVRQVPLPVCYGEVILDCAYRLDIVVEDQVILELKAVDEILPIHEAQMLTYLRLRKLRRGVLINFSVRLLRNGIKRMIL